MIKRSVTDLNSSYQAKMPTVFENICEKRNFLQCVLKISVKREILSNVWASSSPGYLLPVHWASR